MRWYFACLLSLVVTEQLSNHVAWHCVVPLGNLPLLQLATLQSIVVDWLLLRNEAVRHVIKKRGRCWTEQFFRDTFVWSFFTESCPTLPQLNVSAKNQIAFLKRSGIVPLTSVKKLTTGQGTGMISHCPQALVSLVLSQYTPRWTRSAKRVHTGIPLP